MKILVEIPDGQTTGTATIQGAAPPVTPPVDPVVPPDPPPIGTWTPPPSAVVLGSIAGGNPLMPNSGDHAKTLYNLGVMYVWQLGADARDAGIACPSGWCTAGINGSYLANGMDAARVFGQLKYGDWLMVFLGMEDPPGSGWTRHNVPASGLFSGH